MESILTKWFNVLNYWSELAADDLVLKKHSRSVRLILTQETFKKVVIETVKQGYPVDEFLATTLLKFFQTETNWTEPDAAVVHNDL